jgi:hypothetical protein
MPDELKTTCRHCQSNLEYPAEMAGQSIPCPHCGQPTPLPQSKNLTIALAVIAGSVLLVGIACILSQLSHSPPTGDSLRVGTNEYVAGAGLKPVTGAFGYVLGTPGNSSDFTNLNGMPPFDSASVFTTPNGLICDIWSFAVTADYQREQYREQIISVLAEKYGLRPGFTESGYSGKYKFGSPGRDVRLVVQDNHTNMIFHVDYEDENLMPEFYKASEKQAQQEQDQQKANLSNGL